MTRHPLASKARPAGLITAYMATCLVLSQTAVADLDTDPDLFTNQPLAATGQFGWDEFSATGGFGGPHAPDVGTAGVGSAALTATGVPQPMDGPPFGLVAGTQNLYSGGTLGHWDIDLSGLSTTEANTTVVLQLAAQGAFNPASFLLDGTDPTTFVHRGTAPGVTHDIDATQAVADTSYYWAEWQVPAAETYTVEFSGAHTHLSLTGARVDYFNTAQVFDAVAAAAVIPEPSSVVLAGIAIGALVAVGLRRRGGSRGAA